VNALEVLDDNHRRNFRGNGGGGPDSHFLEWKDGPPLYEYIKSEILLDPPLFRPKLRH